jgi:hypothetical protein
LAAYSEYKKHQLASRLAKGGSDTADEEGLECILNTTTMTKDLYEDFRYVKRAVYDQNASSITVLRPAKVTKYTPFDSVSFLNRIF